MAEIKQETQEPKETDLLVRFFDYVYVDSPLWAKHCAVAVITVIMTAVIIERSLSGY